MVWVWGEVRVLGLRWEVKGEAWWDGRKGLFNHERLGLVANPAVDM